eukprot:COSAG01_NODE_2599_length_7398_cov_3.522263_8_plen_151_part_00
MSRVGYQARGMHWASAGLLQLRHTACTRNRRRGSFAVVRRGTRRSDGAAFALKFIDKSSLRTGDEAMLKSETSVLKQVQHPNVIALHEIFHLPTQLVLVMELVTGGEMLQRLRRLRAYSERDAMRCVHTRGVSGRGAPPRGRVVHAADIC